MAGIAMLVLLMGAPAFTAGLVAGLMLPVSESRRRALAGCLAAGGFAGLAAVGLITAGQALLWVVEAPPLLLLFAWNALVGSVGAAAGYGYGWTLAGRPAPDRPHGGWLVGVTLGVTVPFLLVCWIATSLDPGSPAMASPAPNPRAFVPPPEHRNAPDYTLSASCRRRLAHRPAGPRLPYCQWYVLEGDIAWVQDQAQQVFEWGDTCGIAMNSDNAPIRWDRRRVTHCLDHALAPLDRSARVLAAHLALITPSPPGPCRSAVVGLAPWPRTILDDAGALDRATNHADAVTVKAYLTKLDEDLAPGTLGLGRAETRCRLV